MSTSSAPGSFSNVVSLLRFPLILLVIAIHALGSELRLPEGSNPYIYISELLSHGIARIAVPLFFFFSGYYTFYHKDWSLPTVEEGVGQKGSQSTLTLPPVEHPLHPHSFRQDPPDDLPRR